MKGLAAQFRAMSPWVQDAVLAVVLTLVNVGAMVPYRNQLHPQGLAVFLVVAETIPLIWRRSWPAAVFIVMGIARVTYDQVPLGYAPLPLSAAIGFYTVVERSSRRVQVLASVLTLVGVSVSQAAPGHNEPYDFIFAVLIFIAAGMAGVIGRTRRGYLAEAESRAAAAVLGRDREAALAAATERTRIARELHDVVAHHVSLIAVQAEAATSLLPGHPAQASTSVEIIGRTARQALTELRRLLGVLRGPAEQLETAPSPSLAELDTVLGQVRGAGLPVDLQVEGTPGPLAEGVGLTAYRIVQEALTNTIRHAPTAKAHVSLRYEPGYITVSVIDSGPVTGAAAVPDADAGIRTAGGFGLAGIVERVASCGGTLTVGPADAGGFAVIARLPAQ